MSNKVHLARCHGSQCSWGEQSRGVRLRREVLMGRVFMGQVQWVKVSCGKALMERVTMGRDFMDETGMGLDGPGTTCYGPFVGIQV